MENSTILDILIVGAGPSGIAAAVEAKRQGLDKIKVLEKGPSHSSMIRSYYKEGKRVDAGYAGIEPICFGVMCLRDGNRETFLSFMDFAIESNKIQIEYQCEVWSIEKKQDLFIIQSNKGVFQARAVIIAIGKMGKPNTPSYYNQIPASLKNQKAILFDINTREINQLNVLVVGGGDSAGEYLDMLHNTNKVFWSYRQKEIQKMNELNKKIVLSLIENNKISPLWGTEITNIEDEQGKAKVYFQNSNFSPLSVDVVLYGLGGMTPVNFLKNISLELNEKSEAKVDPESHESSLAGMYLVGDLLGKGKGGGSIISGFNSAHHAVQDIVKKYFNKAVIPSVVNLDHLKF